METGKSKNHVQKVLMNIKSLEDLRMIYYYFMILPSSGSIINHSEADVYEGCFNIPKTNMLKSNWSRKYHSGFERAICHGKSSHCKWKSLALRGNAMEKQAGT